jgi:hypothetical protein
MPEQELDLLEFATRNMLEAGACAPQIMRRHLLDDPQRKLNRSLNQ